LLKDPHAQAEFRANPEQVLAANGLTDVSASDIHETLPLVTDNRFVELNNSHAVAAAIAPTVGASRVHAAVQYLQHITTTYRYDDHGAHAHNSGHGNIWATGDVSHGFDHDRFDHDRFDHGHGPTGGSFTGSGGAPGDGSWQHDGHGYPAHSFSGDPTYGQGGGGIQSDSSGNSPDSGLHHSGDDHSDDLRSFGSGATTTSGSQGGTGNPGAYSSGTGASHHSYSFHPADSGTASQTGPDDQQTHDTQGNFGGSYSGHDSYYGHEGDHGSYDQQEPHVSLELHLG